MAATETRPVRHRRHPAWCGGPQGLRSSGPRSNGTRGRGLGLRCRCALPGPRAGAGDGGGLGCRVRRRQGARAPGQAGPRRRVHGVGGGAGRLRLGREPAADGNEVSTDVCPQVAQHPRAGASRLLGSPRPPRAPATASSPGRTRSMPRSSRAWPAPVIAALAADRPAEAAATLREALSLWRGPAYVGVDSPVVLAAARRLEELRFAALEDRLAADLELGHFAVGGCRAGTGCRGTSVPRTVLGPAGHRALPQRPAGRRPRGIRSLPAGPGRRGGRRARAGAQGAPGASAVSGPERCSAHATRPPVVPAALALPGGPLVGRDARGCGAATPSGRASDEPRLLVIRGPAGAGATRLAAELADHVVSCGGVVTLDGAAPDGGLAVYDRPAALPPHGTAGRDPGAGSSRPGGATRAPTSST